MILAIGFIALIGFVGIVTDVSLLFVRFSTLRRAVDAAAVAAAGQMRRVPTEMQMPDGSIVNISEGESQARSLANMNLAARQFIEFYGLDPSDIIVETCQTVIGNAAAGADNDGNLSINTSAQPLCTTDERKLVRVTAQIQSPTTFFSLFGFRAITLQASSVSETAVLDMVFIMDVSESMLVETTPITWAEAGYPTVYLPPQLPNPTGESPAYSGIPQSAKAFAWESLVNSPMQTIRTNLLSGGGTILNNTGAFSNNIRTYVLPGYTANGTNSSGGTNGTPDPWCTVRFYPASYLKAGTPNQPETIDAYIAAAGGLAQLNAWFGTSLTRDQWISSGMNWSGFVPMYNFYGCCNDPNGDWDFSDAVCQPFRTARDSSVDFMQMLDFIRGDRIGIVTFDRRAFLIDPNPADLDTRDAMITSLNLAQSIMRERVGVRAEPSFYRDEPATAPDGRWDTFNIGGTARSWNWLETTPVDQITDSPTNGACPYDRAILSYPLTLMRNATDTQYRTGILPGDANYIAVRDFPVGLDEIDTVPAWYFGTGASDWVRTYSTAVRNRLRRSYEHTASCAGTNIGDGLGTASQTLGRLGRREGAVWIMVLLSDGAAGASAPTYRGSVVSTAALPYNSSGVGAGVQPLAGQYGYTGLCPYGENPTTNTTSSPRSNAYLNNERPYAGELLQDITFPLCSDVRPETRHWCTDQNVPANPEDADTVGPVRINLDDSTDCTNYYDVDDYARDWADYIAVRELNVFRESLANPPLRNNTDTLLPTIFTIGFGLSFDAGSCASPPNFGANNALRNCNVEDYLGEELLRYIADAGDNFRIDNDYWQTVLGYRIPNRASLSPGSPGSGMLVGQASDWGPRGACETPNGTQGVWSPYTSGQSCGNYWNAGTGEGELDEVFAEIAARMFTRLAG